MKRVKVTFYLDPTDDQDSTGLTEDDYLRLTDDLMQLGAEDYEIELEG